jgi:hypothetical protein
VAPDDLAKEERSNYMLVPKFMVGLKADVKNNLHFIDENTVCYPVGHNIVLYNTEDKSQKYISGVEGSLEITAMALTRNKKYLAVAERTERSPICIIYDLQTLKRKKIIATNEVSTAGSSFSSIAFSPKNDKMLVTLTDEPL